MKDEDTRFDIQATFNQSFTYSDPTWGTKLDGTVMLEGKMAHQTGKATGSAIDAKPKDYYYPSLDDMMRWQRDYGVELPSVAPRINVY